MREHTYLSDECNFDIKLTEHDGLFIMSLSEYELNEAKSKKDHKVYERSSTTEVYFGEHELNQVAKVINSFLDIENE